MSDDKKQSQESPASKQPVSRIDESVRIEKVRNWATANTNTGSIIQKSDTSERMQSSSNSDHPISE